MSNSLEFCKKRALDPNVSSYADRDWSKAKEYGIENLLDELLSGHREYKLTGRDEFGEPISYNVKIEIDPDADFDYFSSDSFLCDGTMIFLAESLEKMIKKIVSVMTYNKNLGKPTNGCTVNYTIGNAVILSEFDGDWIPKSKPWLRERTTVLLPLKMSWESRDE